MDLIQFKQLLVEKFPQLCVYGHNYIDKHIKKGSTFEECVRDKKMHFERYMMYFAALGVSRVRLRALSDIHIDSLCIKLSKGGRQYEDLDILSDRDKRYEFNYNKLLRFEGEHSTFWLCIGYVRYTYSLKPSLKKAYADELVRLYQNIERSVHPQIGVSSQQDQFLKSSI